MQCIYESEKAETKRTELLKLKLVLCTVDFYYIGSVFDVTYLCGSVEYDYSV